ncbi:chalcone isomerase family protein [Salinimonas marina]|uniref:Chalcone isomerase family protein n=2 Tax=Salinimonas marina TaxID=2785918 RepID=A0A7S9HEX9_9ALTE|nr:chalcone isomerase family protein [Salinimonas marina]
MLLSLLSFNAFADISASIKEVVEAPAKVGEARFSYYFWDVYDATLYAPKGRWNGQPPYALKLTYLRDLKGKKIAQRSVKEMKKQGLKDATKLAQWRGQMQQIFPDVKENDVLIGIATSQQTTRFVYNGEVIGNIDDADFTQRFFDIWLSEKTSEPEFRQQLLEGAN